MNKSDKKIIIEAAMVARDQWEQSARNYGVTALQDDRIAIIPVKMAARKRDALERKIIRLDAAIAKLR